MRVLARPLIYFKSNRPIKNWKLVVSEGMEENYCVSRTDSCCPCDSFLSSQLREWEFLRWEHWGIETLRVCARSQSWQVVKLRRETASDICVLYRREKKKISQRDLGGYFMEDCLSVSSGASGEGGDWWEREPAKWLGLSSCYKDPPGEGARGGLAWEGWVGTATRLGEPFLLDHCGSAQIIVNPQEFVLVVECASCRLELMLIPHATFEPLRCARHCADCFPEHCCCDVSAAVTSSFHLLRISLFYNWNSWVQGGPSTLGKPGWLVTLVSHW